jgi:hypothetical protein
MTLLKKLSSTPSHCLVPATRAAMAASDVLISDLG